MPPKLTNPLRPAARYRPGKAPVPVASDESSDDDDAQREQQEDQQEDDEDVSEFSGGQLKQQQGAGGRLNVQIREVEVDQGGKVRVGGKDEVGRTQLESESEYETDTDEEPRAPAKPVFRAPAAAEEESSEYETDSEEEEPLKPIYKPVFVSKRNRDTIDKKALDPEAQEVKREEELKKQRDASKNLVADSIVRELAEKEAQVTKPDVDDTDGLDPEAEFEAWKLRELQRLKRDKEARYALEKLREEVEARRALPEELRLKEDTARADKSRKDKGKGNKAFLDKYHHKGVFHQDLDILKKHDYTAPTQSSVVDVSSLPAVMQKRNFGKAHQTKYTHLADQDTSRGGGGWGKDSKPGMGEGNAGRLGGGGAAGQGCFNCGGPHLKRDCPQLEPGAAGAGPSATGANSGARDGGWGSRPPVPSRSNGPAPSDAPGGGRRGGPGIGFGAAGRGRDEPSWRDRGGAGGGRDDRGDRYAPRRQRSRSRERRWSKSPPPSSSRYRDERDRDDRYGGGGSGRGGGRYDDRDRDRERDYRRRSRSPPPMRDERQDDRGGGRGRNRRDDDRDRRERRDRDDDRGGYDQSVPSLVVRFFRSAFRFCVVQLGLDKQGKSPLANPAGRAVYSHMPRPGLSQSARDALREGYNNHALLPPGTTLHQRLADYVFNKTNERFDTTQINNALSALQKDQTGVNAGFQRAFEHRDQIDTSRGLRRGLLEYIAENTNPPEVYTERQIDNATVKRKSRARGSNTAGGEMEPGPSRASPYEVEAREEDEGSAHVLHHHGMMFSGADQVVVPNNEVHYDEQRHLYVDSHGQTVTPHWMDDEFF
ncbi:hypothetical protein JCM8547_005219 [Rhodosporidiobolus lusitaniae]